MMNARRRMLSMMKTDVRDLVFQFTGQYTDEYVTIDGNLYRVLGFLTDGTLTLDQDMVGDIPFDAWVVAGGGKGSAGSGASSSYRVTDFIEKAANDGNYRYYKHVGQDGSISSQACYYCAITNNRITYSEKLSQILNGECEGSISTLLQQIRKYQSEYNIAIARERYVQKKY